MSFGLSFLGDDDWGEASPQYIDQYLETMKESILNGLQTLMAKNNGFVSAFAGNLAKSLGNTKNYFTISLAEPQRKILNVQDQLNEANYKLQEILDSYGSQEMAMGGAMGLLFLLAEYLGTGQNVWSNDIANQVYNFGATSGGFVRVGDILADMKEYGPEISKVGGELQQLLEQAQGPGGLAAGALGAYALSGLAIAANIYFGLTTEIGQVANELAAAQHMGDQMLDQAQDEATQLVEDYEAQHNSEMEAVMSAISGIISSTGQDLKERYINQIQNLVNRWLTSFADNDLDPINIGFLGLF